MFKVKSDFGEGLSLSELRKAIKYYEQLENPSSNQRWFLRLYKERYASLLSTRILMWIVIGLIILCIVLSVKYQKEIDDWYLRSIWGRDTPRGKAKREGAAYYWDHYKRYCTETKGPAFLTYAGGGHKIIKCLNTNKVVYDFTDVAIAQENKRLEREGAKFYYKEYITTRTIDGKANKYCHVYKVEKETGRPYRVSRSNFSDKNGCHTYSIHYYSEEPEIGGFEYSIRGLIYAKDEEGHPSVKLNADGTTFKFTEDDPIFKQYATKEDTRGGSLGYRLNKDFEWKGWRVE